MHHHRAPQPVNGDEQAKGDHRLAPDAKTGKAAKDQSGKTDHRCDEAKQRLRKTAMQFFGDDARCGVGLCRNLAPIPKQIGRHHGADRRVNRIATAHQGRNIKGKVAEFGRGQTVAFGVQPLRHTAEHDQRRAIAIARQIGFGGGIDHPLIGLAPIRQENITQHSIVVDGAGVEGHIVRRV